MALRSLRSQVAIRKMKILSAKSSKQRVIDRRSRFSRKRRRSLCWRLAPYSSRRTLHLSKTLPELLVADALMMVNWHRGKHDALLHHYDRGSWYISEQFHG
jgi:transposase InsO family protein